MSLYNTPCSNVQEASKKTDGLENNSKRRQLERIHGEKMNTNPNELVQVIKQEAH